MRGALKTVNRVDTIWTTFLMVPALIMLLSAGISMYQGNASKADVAQSATVAAKQFVGQYSTYTEATGSAIATGATKLFKVAMNSHKSVGRPIYLQSGMKNHSFGKRARIKPYNSTYR